MHYMCQYLSIIGSDNGLATGWRQAIIWTNAGILLIGTSGTNCSEILIEILIFSFKKMHKFESGICEMAAILSWPQCVNGPLYSELGGVTTEDLWNIWFEKSLKVVMGPVWLNDK